MWQIVYRLTSSPMGRTVAQGHIKDYPTSQEALDRLAERITTAIEAELRDLDRPETWALRLEFQIGESRRPSVSSSGAPRQEPSRPATATSAPSAPSSGQSSPKPATETAPSESQPRSKSKRQTGGGS